jgi:hypothetical protein
MFWVPSDGVRRLLADWLACAHASRKAARQYPRDEGEPKEEPTDSLEPFRAIEGGAGDELFLIPVNCIGFSFLGLIQPFC